MSTTESPNELSPRLQEFQGEVDSLKVDGGKSNPERIWLILSRLGLLVGIILSLVSWLSTQGSTRGVWTDDYAAMGTFGLTLAVASGAVFIVMSLRRYFRYWLVRLIFEQREQTDRILGK
jgi:ABC-type sulfate transport system permease component